MSTRTVRMACTQPHCSQPNSLSSHCPGSPISILDKDGTQQRNASKRVNFQKSIRPPRPDGTSGRLTPVSEQSCGHVIYAKGKFGDSEIVIHKLPQIYGDMIITQCLIEQRSVGHWSYCSRPQVETFADEISRDSCDLWPGWSASRHHMAQGKAFLRCLGHV